LSGLRQSLAARKRHRNARAVARAQREERVTRPAQTPSGDRFAVFKEHLRRQGLKSTAQRDDIARVFFASHPHLSVEELYRAVKRINPRIGYATVYRTMKLLTECGLAVERHFRDGEARYESQSEGKHHDHLICERCGKIVEFEEERIEALQAEVATQLGFRITGHKMELYGVCADCDRRV
jgi:Fur family ferric uptake transcriptional regulator